MRLKMTIINKEILKKEYNQFDIDANKIGLLIGRGSALILAIFVAIAIKL